MSLDVEQGLSQYLKKKSNFTVVSPIPQNYDIMCERKKKL